MPGHFFPQLEGLRTFFRIVLYFNLIFWFDAHACCTTTNDTGLFDVIRAIFDSPG